MDRLILFLILSLMTSVIRAAEGPLDDFSLASYPQEVETYLPVNESRETMPLVSEEYQQKQKEGFYKHYFASDDNALSPWGSKVVEALLPRLLLIEQAVLDEFDNTKQDAAHQHNAHNFKKHDALWLAQIKKNMQLSTLNQSSYDASRRAIATQNTFIRALPDLAPDYYPMDLLGEGLPVDKLQRASIYAGTPLYVLHLSEDRAFALVLTPHACMGWLKISDMAYVSAGFVQTWQKQVQKDLRVISHLKTSLMDVSTYYQLTAYLGAVFPLAFETDKAIFLYVPVKKSDGMANMKIVKAEKEALHALPMPVTVSHLRSALKTMLNQPYGWGGAYFYEDSASAMRHMFTLFGIWLPYDAVQQAQLSPVVDLKNRKVEERIQFLKAEADPLLTLIYVGNQVMLYLGEKPHGQFEGEPITYQSIWGLPSRSGNQYYVVGQSVFLPLLRQFPEYPDVRSQAEGDAFSLIFLRRLVLDQSPEVFVNRFFYQIGGSN